jgi:periplasmic protein TonB
VAYRTDVNRRDRSAAIIAVIAIHAALLFAFLNLSGTIDLGNPQSALRVIDLANPPPPSPPPQQRQQPKPKQKEGASAPKNVRSQATPVAAPKPLIETPPVQKIVASATPRQGTAPTQGASYVPGPGTGAGGTGTGAGSGSGGTGPGGGGDNGVAVPPHLATPVLSGRDIPREILDRWPPRTTVFMRLRVDARGYVAECTVDRGTGQPAIDSTLCNIAHERLRFRPALNRSGQAVAGWFGYAQPAPR